MLIGEPYYVPGSVLVTVDTTVSTADEIPAVLDFAFLGAEASSLAALSVRFCVTQPLVFESLLSARGYARQWRFSGNETDLVPAFMALTVQ